MPKVNVTVEIGVAENELCCGDTCQFAGFGYAPKRCRLFDKLVHYERCQQCLDSEQKPKDSRALAAEASAYTRMMKEAGDGK